MADNVPITAGSGTTIGTEDVGSGVQLQRVKLDIGGHGVSVPLIGDAVHGIPVNVTQVQGNISADTELPPPSGLSDGKASIDINTSIIGSYGHLYDSGADEWNRWRGTIANGALVEVSQIDTTVNVKTELPLINLLQDATPNPQTTSVGALGLTYNGATWDRKRSVGGVSDGGSTGLDASGKYRYNGTNWDRERNNTQETLLNGNFATTQSAAAQINYNARGVILYLAISAMPASAETLTPVIEVLDPVGGTSIVQLTNFPPTAPGNQSGAPLAYAYIVYPGASSSGLPPYVAGTSTNVAYAESIPIPRNWRCRVIHSGSSTWDYTLGVSYVL